jgi:hypothetical protein
MDNDQQLTIAQQLERAAEIMRSDATDAEKINTLERIGGICSHAGRKWGDETFYKLVDSLNH